jgi:hypothetical protein
MGQIFSASESHENWGSHGNFMRTATFYWARPEVAPDLSLLENFKSLAFTSKIESQCSYITLPQYRGCSGKMANFGTSLLGPENQGYVSYDVCDDGPKI